MSKKICILAGSRMGKNPEFAAEAAALGCAIAEEGAGLVAGSASIGLMKVCAEAVHQAGGSVDVVIPSIWLAKEAAQPAFANVTEVSDQAARTRIFLERGVGFIALPGSFGTLEEIAALCVGRQYGQHNKPVVAFNVADYWNNLLALTQDMAAEGNCDAGILHIVSAARQAVRCALG